MSARPIATVRAADGYAGILKAFRDRQAQLGLSGEKLDEIIGNDGNRSSIKWLTGIYALGEKSWGDALGGTAMYVTFHEDAEQLKKIQKHLQSRNKSQVRTNVRIRVTKWLFNPRSARRAGKSSAAKLTAKERSERARKASNTRWRRVRERRRAARCAPTITDASRTAST